MEQSVMALFDASQFPGIDIESELISAANDGVQKLRSRLVDRIAVSHLPWTIVQANVQIFFQGHTRRALMFAEGGYDACVAGRGLVVYGCVRAIYETVACVMDFCDKLSGHLASGDFPKTCVFVLSRQFAARMEEFIDKQVIYAETVDTTAVNILTQIDRVSEHVPGFREEYDLLSEMTHPNGLGALCHFWDSGEDVIKFSDGADQENAINCLLSAAGRLLVLMHVGMSVMEERLAKHSWF
jgi:hypothetical protein